jgi:hypothetical protein
VELAPGRTTGPTMELCSSCYADFLVGREQVFARIF